jgi:hypothetical protein
MWDPRNRDKICRTGLNRPGVTTKERAAKEVGSKNVGQIAEPQTLPCGIENGRFHEQNSARNTVAIFNFACTSRRCEVSKRRFIMKSYDFVGETADRVEPAALTGRSCGKVSRPCHGFDRRSQDAA